jgi:hypothetical protein
MIGLQETASLPRALPLLWLRSQFFGQQANWHLSGSQLRLHVSSGPVQAEPILKGNPALELLQLLLTRRPAGAGFQLLDLAGDACHKSGGGTTVVRIDVEMTPGRERPGDERLEVAAGKQLHH